MPIAQLARELGLSSTNPSFDDNLPTEDDSDDWEKALITNHTQQHPDANIEKISSDDEDVTSESTPDEHLSLDETLAAFKKIHETTTVSSIQFQTQAIITELEELVVKRRVKDKQTTLDSFICSA